MDKSGRNFFAGFGAGLVATIVLTALMMVKGAMGLMPELDPVHMMSVMVSDMMGFQENAAVGWVMHFMIGAIVWGGLFSIFFDFIPGSSAMVKGILFGIGAWLAMMIGPMPMSGAGFFGLGMGIVAPMMTIMLHIVFGAVLGTIYMRLARP